MIAVALAALAALFAPGGAPGSTRVIDAPSGRALPDPDAQSLAKLSSIPLEAGWRVEDALAIDLDLDGDADLVIASSRAARGATGDRGARDDKPDRATERSPAPQRRLELHLRKKSGPAFASAPDASLDVTPDVVAYGAADVHADPGREILLYGASGVFAWRWRAKEESQRFVKVVECDLLWQVPDPRQLFHWQAGVVDLDGDGLEDIVVPGPWLYAVAFQERAADGSRSFGKPTLITFGDDEEVRRSAVDGPRRAEMRQPGSGRRRFSMNLDENGLELESERVDSGPYLSVDERVPAVQIVDWDGDGALDLVLLSARHLSVFLQQPKRTFGTVSLRRDSPVPLDRQRALDVSFKAYALDLDGDHRCDCLFFAGDKRSDSPRTQALVFLQTGKPGMESQIFGPAAGDKGGAPEGTPKQLIVLDGFARPLALVDVDGDGRPDLVAGAIKPDLIDEIRTATSERVDTEVYVYRNSGAGFSKRPDLTYKLSLEARQFEYAADFVGDVTGDGVSEFLERADKDRLRLHLVRKGKDGALTVIDKPIWELAVDEDAKLLQPVHLGQGFWDLFVVDKERISCASFR